MGTQGHLKQKTRKQSDSPTTTKRPGKFGRFARRAVLFAGLAAGIIAPSLSSAQGKDIAKAFPSQDGDKNKIALTTAGEKLLPKNTLVLPDTAPVPSYTRNVTPVGGVPENATADGKDAKKIEPDPNGPFKVEGGWAESVEIRNDSLIFNKVEVNGKKATYGGAPIGEFLMSRGIVPENRSIKSSELREINADNRCGAIVFVSNGKSLLYYLTTNLTKNDFGAVAVSASDGSVPFEHKEALIVSLDGSAFTLTPTTFLGLIPVKDKFLKIDMTFSEIVGQTIPPFEKPVIDIKNGKVRIRDRTISDEAGKKYDLLINPFTIMLNPKGSIELVESGEPLTKN